MDRLNKKDLVDFISEENHITKVEAKDIVENIFRHIEDALIEGKEVNLSNFGVLVPITRKARVGTDPKKHQKITIKETKSISFRASKLLKDRMN